MTRRILIGIAVSWVAVLILAPLLAVFLRAFSGGLGLYWAAISHPSTLAAARLSLVVAAIVVPINTVFGVAAAWAIAKVQVKGRRTLTALIDLPLAVSPVIAGMIFALLFGPRGWLGPTADQLGVKIIFATPGIVLATCFVTLPLVARELIPFFESQGVEQEEAALSLGANTWQTLWRVTLPSAKWSLLYGVVLTAARSLGEFGAVSVVSGHVRDRTNTLPLHVELLYNEYGFSSAFAVSSLLTGLALVSLILRHVIERRSKGTGWSPVGGTR